MALEQLENRLVPTVAINEVFELDGNAITNTLHSAPIPAGSSTTTSHDWDQVYQDFLNGNTALSGAQVVAFVTDATGAGTTSFTSGSHEDGAISTWAWQTPEHSEDKNDLLHAMVAAYIRDGDLFIYFGADRFAQNGDAKIGLWFFQNSVGLNPNGTFSGSHTVGDILIESTFTQGGGTSTILVYEWVGSGGSNGSLDLISPQLGSIVNDGTNSNAQNATPWPYNPKTGPANRFPTGAFYEGGLNLSAVLEGAGVLQPGDCLDFSSFMANTRSSASLSSALDDFVLGNAHISTCGSVSWEKRDGTGALLGGAAFEVSPDPTDNVGVLQVVDNTGQPGYTGADVDPTAGVFKVIDMHPGTYTINETVPPPGYFLEPGNTSRTVVVPESGNLDVSIGTMGQDDTSDFHNFKPAINIVKFANGQDADSPTGPNVATGSTVTFTYVVTNTGDAPLANVSVTDDKLGTITSFTGDTNNNGLLDLTETWTYTTTATSQAGQQTNVGIATGQAVGQTVSDDNPANYFGDAPAINIVKFANGQDADSPTGPHVAAGSTVTFTYVVTNTGNVPIANVAVTDDKLGAITSFTGDTNGNNQLDLTETWTYTTTATAQPGQQTNVGTASGADAFTAAPVTDNNPANYFGDAPAINIVKFANGQDADTPTGPLVSAGSTVTFTYVVTNTGNVPLANVVVSDDKLGPITSFTGDTNSNGLLDLTETWTYSTTATALAGQQTNIGTVTGADANGTGQQVSDDNPANYFGDAPAINIVKFANGQDADVPTGPIVAVGSTLTFTYVVTNTGNVPLANVVVDDDKLGPITSFTGDTNGNGLLDLTETWTYTTTATAQAGQQTNVGTTTAQDANTGATVSDDNPANYFGGTPAINIVKFVNGDDANLPTGPHVATGSTATFTYVVTNVGNVPLANVIVDDDKLGPITSFTGDTNGNGLLDTTETWTYTQTATAQPGQQTNVGTVTAQETSTGTSVSSNNPANYFGDAPAIKIVKFANGQDADSPTGPHAPAGSTVTFTYVVTNTGNVPIANVAVNDDKLGTITSFIGDTNSNGLLDLTEIWIYTTTATAQPGQQTNVGTVTGDDANGTGQQVTDNNPANYFGDAPAINIVKFANGQDADSPTGPHVPAGSTVTFTYVVTNTGNVPLANVVVNDDKLGPITSFIGDANGDGLLDLTETWIYTTTATAVAGQQTNVGTVTGDDANATGQQVSDDNPANYFGDSPAISIVKTANGHDSDCVNVPTGSTVTFTYVVTNTGNVPIANVAVTDNVLGAITSFTGDTNGDGLLDLTETWTYTATATAQAGDHENIGTVNGNDSNIVSLTVSASDGACYFGDSPAINIVKSANGSDSDCVNVPTGSTVTFTYVVTNTGNVPIANVAVTDNVLGAITSFTGDTNNNGLLDLTETWTYTATATAQAGDHENIGTVNGNDSNIATATVTANDNACYFGDAPAINIVKFANGQDADSPTGPHVAAGSTVTFTYVVTNPGNVPLANVVVTDDKLGTITSFSGDTNGNGLLDLTETWTYTKTATALAGQQTNVGTVTGGDANNISQQVSDDNPANYFGDRPEIKLIKIGALDLGANLQADPGDLIHYTFTVINTGNVTLTNVTLSDLVGGVTVGPLIDSALGNGATVLAVGEVETATGTYAITQADIDAGTKFNVAKATGLSSTTEESVESDSNAIVPILAPAPTLRLGSLSGTVYLDLNNNGKQDKKEKGIKGATVTLQLLVNGVWTTVATTKTNAKGNYAFGSLSAGTYRVIETQPKGFRDGKDTLGRINGITRGSKNANDQFTVSLLSGALGVDYNFGERVSKTIYI